jgi:hypothetical protein
MQFLEQLSGSPEEARTAVSQAMEEHNIFSGVIEFFRRELHAARVGLERSCLNTFSNSALESLVAFLENEFDKLITTS